MDVTSRNSTGSILTASNLVINQSSTNMIINNSSTPSSLMKQNLRSDVDPLFHTSAGNNPNIGNLRTFSTENTTMTSSSSKLNELNTPQPRDIPFFNAGNSDLIVDPITLCPKEFDINMQMEGILQGFSFDDDIDLNLNAVGQSCNDDVTCRFPNEENLRNNKNMADEFQYGLNVHQQKNSLEDTAINNLLMNNNNLNSVFQFTNDLTDDQLNDLAQEDDDLYLNMNDNDQINTCNALQPVNEFTSSEMMQNTSNTFPKMNDTDILMTSVEPKPNGKFINQLREFHEVYKRVEDDYRTGYSVTEPITHKLETNLHLENKSIVRNETIAQTSDNAQFQNNPIIINQHYSSSSHENQIVKKEIIFKTNPDEFKLSKVQQSHQQEFKPLLQIGNNCVGNGKIVVAVPKKYLKSEEQQHNKVQPICGKVEHFYAHEKLRKTHSIGKLDRNLAPNSEVAGKAGPSVNLKKIYVIKKNGQLMVRNLQSNKIRYTVEVVNPAVVPVQNTVPISNVGQSRVEPTPSTSGISKKYQIQPPVTGRIQNFQNTVVHHIDEENSSSEDENSLLKQRIPYSRLPCEQQKILDAEKYRKAVAANNEASRRCREKKKQLKKEMSVEFDILHGKNKILRSKKAKLDRQKEILLKCIKAAMKHNK